MSNDATPRPEMCERCESCGDSLNENACGSCLECMEVTKADLLRQCNEARAEKAEQRAEAAEAALAAEKEHHAHDLEVLAESARKRREAEAALAKVTEERDQREARDMLMRSLEDPKMRAEFIKAWGAEAAIEDMRKAEDERDAALKACAEMRKALEKYGKHLSTCSIGMEDYGERLGCDCGLFDAGEDAGRGYASPDEKRALAERVREACIFAAIADPDDRVWLSRTGVNERIRALDLSQIERKP